MGDATLFRNLETFARELGIRLGRQLVERLAAEHRALGETAPPPALAPSRPALMPGLAGRRRRPGEPPPPCGKPGCNRPARTRGYCQTHYVQWLKSR